MNGDDSDCVGTITIVSGCTDATADNYDATATIDDGSCTYTTDCAGIVNGTAVVDSCGVCNQAYIYNFITHAVAFVDNANILIPGMDYDPSQEMVVLPGSAGDPAMLKQKVKLKTILLRPHIQESLTSVSHPY